MAEVDIVGCATIVIVVVIVVVVNDLLQCFRVLLLGTVLATLSPLAHRAITSNTKYNNMTYIQLIGGQLGMPP